MNDLIDESELGRFEWIGKLRPVFCDEVRLGGGRIRRSVDLSAVDDIDGSVGSHDRDLGGGPCEIHVSAQVFARHDVVGATVGFACDDRDLGDGRLCIGVEELRSMFDDAAELLCGAGQEAGDIDEGDDRNVECVTETNESSGFDARVDVEAARQHVRLIGDDADRRTCDSRQTNDDILCVAFLDLEEDRIVDDLRDDLLDVVGFGRVGRDE